MKISFDAQMNLYLLSLLADLTNPETDLQAVNRDHLGMVLRWIYENLDRELLTQ